MYVIMYHYVRRLVGSRYPQVKGLELHYFESQLQFLQQNGFHFVTLDEVIERGDSLPDKSVLLTFDDGYIDHYINVFPILDRNGIQGVFSMPGKILREKSILDVNKIHYVLASVDIRKIKTELFSRMNFYRGKEFDYPPNEELYQKLAVKNRFDDADTIFVKRALQAELPEHTRNLIAGELFRQFVTANEEAFVTELYMDMSHIKTMHKHGMKFGVHGYDHYWMNRLTESQLRNDITKALTVFDGVIDNHDWTCCYPYGSYSDDVIGIVKELGASSGLSTDVAVYHPVTDDIFIIPRFDTNDFPPKSENYLTKE